MQHIKFEEEGGTNTYLIQHVYYDGNTWRQTVDWDGKNKSEY